MTPAEQMAKELGNGWVVINETTVRNYDKVANVSRYETVTGFRYSCEGAHGANDFIDKGYGETPQAALDEWVNNVNEELECARAGIQEAKDSVRHAKKWLKKMEKIASWVNNVSTASPTN